MKYIDEYRDGSKAKKLAREIQAVTTQPWILMEICGGQTHQIAKFRLEELFAQNTDTCPWTGLPGIA